MIQAGGQYGGAPGGGFGAPLGAPGGGMGSGGGGPRGEMRNPVMVLVISMICCVYGFIQLWSMLSELKEYTRDESFAPWQVLIPVLNIYFLFIKVPEQVNKAKQMAGSRNPQNAGILLYILIPYFALAKDLNEVWDPNAS